MGFSRQDLSPTVTHSLRRLLHELGGTFSHEHLRGYIERWRGKPLRLEEDTMPPGMTGYAIALRDCDLIATRRGLTKTQKKITQLHEMAHFINGDLPLYSHGEATAGYRQFLRQQQRHNDVTSRQRFFDTFDDMVERNAETLARILANIITAHAQNESLVLSDLLEGD
ncbi:hypothetical protein [Herpetosiphon giganteus]|uniref:hypothetical protein n=1 Tax=Herpetosiphon giganteus TaxID=2029754 RepID=UPI00195928AE|nr:hypothetical protein [Herpetosiphon giganteus]MBM7846670.1 hypothetical protein [Herpetosiphon giganteus]